MRKSLFNVFAVIALIVGAGALTVNALWESTPTVTGIDLGLTSDNFTVEESAVFDIPNKKIYPRLEFTLPTTGHDDNNVEQELSILTRVLVQRANSINDENPVTVYDMINRLPGERIVVEDRCEDLEKGDEYVYRIYAFTGETYRAITAHITVGIKPFCPNPVYCTSTEGENPIVLKVACPEKEYGNIWTSTPFPEGVEFTSLKFFVVDNETNTEVLIHEVADPVTGSEYEYRYYDAKPGMNCFKFRADTDFGNSDYVSANVYVGPDFPAAPKNLNAEAIDEYVIISWSPSQPYYGGKYNPENVEYTVYRNNNDEKEAGANDKKWIEIGKTRECKFKDILGDLAKETSVKYKVVPDNGVVPDTPYNSAETYSGIIVGPPAALPYIETFNNGKKYSKDFDNRWYQNFDYDSFGEYSVKFGEIISLPDGSGIEVMSGAAGGNQKDENGCDNYFYITHNDLYDSIKPGYITSGKISLKDAENPYVSFCYVPVKGSSATVTVEINTGEVDEDNQPVYYKVQTVQYDDEYTVAGKQSLPMMITAEDEEYIAEPWKRVHISLADYAGEESCRIRFTFRYMDAVNRLDICFDEVKIDDYPPVIDISAFTVDGVNYAVDGDRVEATEIDENLSAVTIPATVTYSGKIFNVTMGAGLFSGNTVIENVIIDAAIENLGAETFCGATALKSVTLPESIIKIDKKAFFGCVSLKDIEFPESLMMIDTSAFENCTSIESIEFGKNIVKIGDRAFFNCSELAYVIFNCTVPPTVGADAFKGVADPCLGTCPDGTVEEYKSVDSLSPISFDWAGIDSINSDEIVSVEYFSLSGLRIDEPIKGLPVIVRIRYAGGKVKVEKRVN